MTTRQPWMKWYPADFRADPRVRMCSLATRGLWIELLGYMHEAEPYGVLTIAGLAPSVADVASLVGAPVRDVAKAVAELQAKGVCGVDNEGRIYSRRMVRDHERAAADRANGNGGGNPNIARGSVPREQRVRPFKRSDAPAKTLRIFDRSGGRCHWCSKPLRIDGPLGPDLFHVDHVVAVRDGGTNDEGNLVAACAECNHKRALADTGHQSDHNRGVAVGMIADSKAQKPEARSQIPEARNKNPEGTDETPGLPVGAAQAPPRQGDLIAREPSKGRGTRLPEAWPLTLELREIAIEARDRANLPPIDVETEHARFLDYWHAKAGRDACKVDWIATWRNWCRNSKAGIRNDGRTFGERMRNSIAEAASMLEPERTEAPTWPALPGT